MNKWNNTEEQLVRWSTFEKYIALKIAELYCRADVFEEDRLMYSSKICGTYVLVNKNTRQVYIGSSSNLYQRKLKHLRTIRNGTHDNPNVRTSFSDCRKEDILFFIWPTNNREVAFDLEQQFLNDYGDNPKCLNIATDSRIPGKGMILSAVSRKKMSEGLCKRWSNPEYKQRIVDTFKAKGGITDKHRNKLVDSNGNPVIILGVNYRSIREAAKKLEIKNTSLFRWLNNGIADKKVSEILLDRKTQNE